MDSSALDDALEGGGWHGFAPLDIRHKGGEVVIDKVGQGLPELIQINGAGLHDPRGIGFVDQREQKMLQRREFVPTRIGQCQCAVDRLFERCRK